MAGEVFSRFKGPILAILLVGALVAVVLISSMPPKSQKLGAESQKVSSAPIIEGRAIFEAKGCVECHAVWGEAGGQPIGPDLGGKAVAWLDIMRFAGTLWNHLPEMTEQMRARGLERPTLTSDDMGKLAAYLFYVRFLGQPGDVDKGRELFRERKCAVCHQFGGVGGTVGPRLDELKNFASVYFFARALWNHGPEMTEKMAELSLDRPRLEGDDVAHIVAFIRGSAQRPGPLEIAYVEAGTPRAGELLFRQKGCGKCHMVDGSGGQIGPDLSRNRSGLTVSELAAAFWNHGTPMWAKMKELGLPVPRLSDREMSDMLAYLAFVQYAGPRGDATRGAALFRQKQCAGCHPVGGKGPQVGPDLSASVEPQSVLRWTAAMWNHAPAMQEKLRDAALAWPRFEGAEMRDVVAYLRSQSRAHGATP